MVVSLKPTNRHLVRHPSSAISHIYPAQLHLQLSTLKYKLPKWRSYWHQFFQSLNQYPSPAKAPTGATGSSSRASKPLSPMRQSSHGAIGAVTRERRSVRIYSCLSIFFYSHAYSGRNVSWRWYCEYFGYSYSVWEEDRRGCCSVHYFLWS